MGRNNSNRNPRWEDDSVLNLDENLVSLSGILSQQMLVLNDSLERGRTQNRNGVEPSWKVDSPPPAYENFQNSENIDSVENRNPQTTQQTRQSSTENTEIDRNYTSDPPGFGVIDIQNDPTLWPASTVQNPQHE